MSARKHSWWSCGQLGNHGNNKAQSSQVLLGLFPWSSHLFSELLQLDATIHVWYFAVTTLLAPAVPLQICSALCILLSTSRNSHGEPGRPQGFKIPSAGRDNWGYPNPVLERPYPNSIPQSPGSPETFWSLHNPAQYHAEMLVLAPCIWEKMRPMQKAYPKHVAHLNMTPRQHSHIS